MRAKEAIRGASQAEMPEAAAGYRVGQADRGVHPRSPSCRVASETHQAWKGGRSHFDLSIGGQAEPGSDSFGKEPYRSSVKVVARVGFGPTTFRL
jgi:hypothetical protein